MKRSKKNFVHQPEYPGGKEQFKKFLKENLVYPKKALENRVEGTVYLVAEVNDQGEVLQVKIEKGIGFGCDEEAIRLVKSLKYGKVTNRGIRLKTWHKLRINFKLADHQSPELSLQYTLKEKKQSEPEQPKGFQYTVSLPLKNN
ncbi:MAG TPA: energy transducer TonB [Sunxiuqinia sp.]|nr:energy transducer TonB [Sunxiuqinia sp.]